MRTVLIFKNANNQAIRLPKDMEYQGISQLEIIKNGDEIILRPVRPNWLSFSDVEKPDDDFMQQRQDVVANEGRFNFD